MSAAITAAPGGTVLPTLRSRKLPNWALPATAVAAVGLVTAVFTAASVHGTAKYALASAALYVSGSTAVSASVEGSRRARDRLATALVAATLILAILPLVAVLGYTVDKGLGRLDATFLTHSMRNVADRDANGGAYHAIVGTVEQVGLATLFSVPLGLLVSIYLVEYARGRFARLVSTAVDVMTGLPSIVAGLFVLSLWILVLDNQPSGFAGALALMILMIPVVVRSTEEMLRLVPDTLREASLALGIPRWRMVVSIVLPTALSGIVTGVMLAVARVTGETAPLLLTVFGSQSINNDPFDGPQEGLPLFVFQQAGLPNATAIDRAWSGALCLILIVMVFNLVVRLVVWRSGRRRR